MWKKFAYCGDGHHTVFHQKIFDFIVEFVGQALDLLVLPS